MRKPREDVFELISNMSPAEKRYFKGHYGTKKNQLVVLFDFLNKMSNYDEQIIKTHFKNSKISKNLKVYKVQLLDLILKSLVSYNSKRDPRSKVRIELEEVDILLGKKMLKLAARKLDRLHQICEDNELTLESISLLAREMRIMVQEPQLYNNSTLIDSPKIDQIVAKLESYRLAMQLNRFLYKAHLSAGKDLESVFEDLEMFLNANEAILDSLQSPRLLRVKNDILARLHRRMGREAESLKYYETNFKAMEKRSLSVEQSAYNYMVYGSNYIGSLINLHRMEEALVLISELKSYAETKSNLGWTVLYPYYYKMQLHYRLEQHEELDQEYALTDKKFGDFLANNVPATYCTQLLLSAHRFRTGRLAESGQHLEIAKGLLPALPYDWKVAECGIRMIVLFESEDYDNLDLALKQSLSLFSKQNVPEVLTEWIKETFRIMNLPVQDRKRAAALLPLPIAHPLPGRFSDYLFNDIAGRWRASMAFGQSMIA